MDKQISRNVLGIGKTCLIVDINGLLFTEAPREIVQSVRGCETFEELTVYGALKSIRHRCYVQLESEIASTWYSNKLVRMERNDIGIVHS